MRPAKSIGRTVGILLLLQLAAALMVPFILLGPLLTISPGFLTAAGENASQVRGAVLLSFVGAALTLTLGITAQSMFRRYSKGAALLFLVACVISCALDLVHGATVMSMLSLSQEYLRAGSDPELFRVVGLAVGSARRWAHLIQLFAIGGWMFVFYGSLFRFAMIPRPLAALGLVGIALQFTGVTLMMILGNNTIGEMAMPLLPIQIAVAVWLIVYGFREPVAESTHRDVDTEPGDHR